MRVFVTGAGGFVGPRLVRRLETAGHDVTAVDLEVDVSDPDAIRNAVEGARPDAVIHLAALSSVATSLTQPDACFRVNFVGSRNLLAAVEDVAPSARVLLIGTGDVYGSAEPGTPPFRESDPIRPRSPYAQTKAAAEKLGSLAAERGLDVARIRPFNHTGAGQDDRFVASSFAKQIAEIRAGRSEAVMRVGNLESVRDFMDVEDVLDAYLALLDPAVPASLYNISTGEGIAVQSLLDTLIELGGVEVRVETDPARMRPTDHLVGNAERLYRATGWQPTTPLRSTLSAILDDWSHKLAAG